MYNGESKSSMKFLVTKAVKLVSLVTLFTFTATAFLGSIASAKELSIEFLYIESKEKRPATLSNLVAPPEDDGLLGAQLGIKDNNTTGRFLKHTYKMDEVVIAHNEDFKARLDEALKKYPNKFVVANLSADKLLQLTDHPLAKERLVFNAGSLNTDLRINKCRPNLLHTIPSRRMLTDGLSQFLIKKNWKKVFLIEGLKRGDKEFAEQFRISAKKFRLKIVTDKKWAEGADMRRNAAAEVPSFTQGSDYDVVFIADEVKDFGQYVSYHTWLPRPIVGSHGIEPVAWHRVVEQWGAAQLQSRFRKLATRPMAQKDYASWTAIRTVAEGVTRLKTTEIPTLKDYILGPKIRLAMFKGRSMSYRPWSGQMRQTIPLIHAGGAVIKLSPIEGFLHPKTELDTLGIDEGQAKCRVQS
ncbi:MAG: branched-chain amino acid ABC transporter substrate-binding protein [Methyloligella sp.]|nr:MAG: branched-chain amino acid ABC transporter substrate-binding protein [Methyloligella sp.]